MKARGYVRVSTDEQAQEGVSIEAQTKILEAYAVVKGYSDFKIYIDDGYSGKNLNRPAVKQLLDECRAGGVDAVIVWRLDRISRSLRDTLMIVEDILQDNSTTLLSVTESIDTSTPAGRLLLNILATFAQHERESDVERVTMAHRHLAKDCRYLGGPVPLGYTIDADKHYQIDETTAPIVRKAFDMYIHREGYAEILRYINAQGVRTMHGRPYAKTTLLSLLTNEKYIGTYIHGRLAPADKKGRRSSSRVNPVDQQIRIPHGIPAIIDQATWDAACALRAENKRSSSSYRTRVATPLQGLVYCGVCGRPMQIRTAGHDKSNPGHWQRYYRCPKNCCQPAEKNDLESGVFEMLEAIISDEAMLTTLVGLINTYAQAAAEDRHESKKDLHARLSKIEQKIRSILDFITTSGAQAPASLAQELTILERTRDEIIAALDAANQPAIQVTMADMQHAVSTIAKIKQQPPEIQKQIIQATVDKVVVSSEQYAITLTGLHAVEMSPYRIEACRARQHHIHTYTHII